MNQEQTITNQSGTNRLTAAESMKNGALESCLMKLESYIHMIGQLIENSNSGKEWGIKVIDMHDSCVLSGRCTSAVLVLLTDMQDQVTEMTKIIYPHEHAQGGDIAGAVGAA